MVDQLVLQTVPHCSSIASHLYRLEEAPSNEAEALEDVEEEEPSWELPEELQDFKGDADDRKGMLAFRQKQQSARQV